MNFNFILNTIVEFKLIFLSFFFLKFIEKILVSLHILNFFFFTLDHSDKFPRDLLE